MLHHNKDGSRLPKVFEETQAEAVAYFVSRGVGLQTTLQRRTTTLYNGDKKTLAQSLSAIHEEPVRPGMTQASSAPQIPDQSISFDR